jgi:hypothetical protein
MFARTHNILLKINVITEVPIYISTSGALTPSSAAVFKLWFYGKLCAANHKTAT